MLEKIDQLKINSRLHLIIQSLNGYRIDDSELDSMTIDTLRHFYESDHNFIKEGSIKKNEWVLLITVSKITHSENMSFEDVALSGLDHKYRLEENFFLDDIMVSLFKIE
tara:strand:- start:305 stop:631 length:327 start_codon:yes stop_codon:yes gene_type:complete